MKSLSGYLYRNIIKPILFIFPADTIHAMFLSFGRMLGKSGLCRWVIRSMWRYDNPKLSQVVLGKVFKNPIGLSAGFDYNADLQNILPDIGFGFHTIGTLTYEAYSGNPAPMLGRLPKSQALLVNKGFKNDGVLEVLSHLGKADGRAVRGVSVGVTNKSYASYADMMDNLLAGFRDAHMSMEFDYYELNISCPNLSNIKELTEQLASPEGLKIALEKLNAFGMHRPVFIKMPLERTPEQMKALIDVVVPFTFVGGLIISNLAKDRNNPAFDRCEVEEAGPGNFSGKPTTAQSDELIKFVYKKYKSRFIIIGVGGVFSAEDAYKKIRSGATLVQLITGMVYQGPQLIGEINEGLVALLKRDKYDHISKAIGIDALVE